VLSNTTVLVRLKASAAAGAANQAIDVTSPIYAEPRQVTLSGEVLPLPSLSVTPGSISNLTIVQLDPATATEGSFSLTGANLQTNVTVVAPTGFQISSASGSGFTNTLSIAASGGNVSTNVFVRMANSAVVGPISGSVSFTSLYGTNRQTNLLRPVFGTVLSWPLVNPDGLRVTNPMVTVTTNATNFAFGGQAGIRINSALRWTNLTSGAAGSFAYQTNWSVTLPLVAGANTLLFSADYPEAVATNSQADDSPGDIDAYGSGWASGQNGGFGFGPWQLYEEPGLSQLDRASVFTTPNMQVAGVYGFAMQSIVGGLAEAYRPFLQPLQAPGGAFTVRFDSNDLQPFGSVGFRLVDSNGLAVFTFSSENPGGAGETYRIVDSGAPYTPQGWTYTKSGLLVRFEMTSSNAYLLTASTTNSVYTHNSQLGSTSPVVGVEFFSASAGAGQNNAFYLGETELFSTTFVQQEVSAIAPDVVRINPPASAYNQWAESFGLNPTGTGAPGADPDSDGFSNDMEFAFGTSPVSANASLLNTAQSGGNMVVTFVARKTGVSYAVTQKSNLAATVPGWTPTAIVPAVSGDQAGVLNPADYERRTFSVPAVGNDFYRVRATTTQ